MKKAKKNQKITLNKFFKRGLVVICQNHMQTEVNKIKKI
jgi:hypothetical protein